MLNQTIKGAVAEYFENITALKSKSSQCTEKTFFRDLEVYFLTKHSQLKDITPKDIDFFQASLLKTKKPQTVNRQFTLYNHFFKKCVEWGYLEQSPARFCKKRREIEPQRELWDDTELEQTLPQLNGYMYNVVKFLSLTGIRPIESTQIKKKDICGNVLRLFTLKNSAGYRLIPLNQKTVELLETVIIGLSDEDLIFKNKHGRPIRTRQINLNLKRLQKN